MFKGISNRRQIMPKVTMEFQRCFNGYKFSVSRIVVEVEGSDELVSGFQKLLDNPDDVNISARATSVKKEDNGERYDLRFFYYDK
jgi:hypothetical protein